MANPQRPGAVRRQLTGSGYPAASLVCSPPHQVMNVSLVALRVLLRGQGAADRELLGQRAASRGAVPAHRRRGGSDTCAV